MKQLETLNTTELKTLLSQLWEYRDMNKKLGQRGKELFHRSLSGTPLFVVEYFPSLSESDVYSSAAEVYKKVFDVEPKQAEVVFVKKDSLMGGMKIYKDDQMVDMSFSKVERLLKK